MLMSSDLNAVVAGVLAVFGVVVLGLVKVLGLPLYQALTTSMSLCTGVGFVALAWGLPFLCRKTCLLEGLFPNIEGTYKMEVSSNWEVVKKLLPPDDSGGQSPTPPVDEAQAANPSVGSSRTALAFMDIGTVVLTPHLSHIDMGFKAKDGYSKSALISSSFIRGKGANPHQILYTYGQTMDKPRPTDEQFFFGAARLDIPREPMPLVLTGVYWTNRKWAAGLNTAGQIRLTRQLPGAQS